MFSRRQLLGFYSAIVFSEKELPDRCRPTSVLISQEHGVANGASAFAIYNNTCVASV